MHGVDVFCGRIALQDAADVHQATDVVRHHHIRTAFDDVFGFGLAHGQRGAGHFYAESAAEAAAFLDVGQFAVFQSSHIREQFHGLFGRAQLAPAVASDVQGGFVRKCCAGVGHAEYIDQEFAKFEHAAAGVDHFIAGIDVSEEHPAHGRARARRADDPAVSFQRLAKVMDHIPGFFPIARVEGRLSAAGLPVRKNHRHTVPFEQSHGGLADGREKLVDITGNEQRHRFALFDTAAGPGEALELLQNESYVEPP